jgi:hypothetical protein
MTREDILRMAREAGLEIVHFTSTPIAIERFAELVAAAEREACAKMVENYTGAWDDEGYALASAIRSGKLK